MENHSDTSTGINGKDSVGLYLEQIAKTPLLTASEEVDLAKQIEAGLYAEKVLTGEVDSPVTVTTAELAELVADGKQAMNRFLQANLRLVVALARKLGRNRQLPILDLIQEGNIGLLRSVEKFDYTKGYKFSTYATWWIRQAICRGAVQQGRIVRIPVHVADQINQVSRARRDLERVLGRDPELTEIAQELEIPVARVTDLFAWAKDHVSLDAPVDDDGDTSLGELIARETTAGPDETVLDMEERRRLEAMLASLDERSADVVRRRYGLLDGRQAKLADIGLIWGITAERVRQIERSALAQMRQKVA